MLDTRDRDPLRPEHSCSGGHTRAICVTARGVLLDARFYCVLRISPVAHIDATCAPAIVRMDATHLVAIPAAWRVSVAAIRVMGVVVVVIPERTGERQRYSGNAYGRSFRQFWRSVTVARLGLSRLATAAYRGHRRPAA